MTTRSTAEKCFYKWVSILFISWICKRPQTTRYTFLLLVSHYSTDRQKRSKAPIKASKKYGYNNWRFQILKKKKTLPMLWRGETHSRPQRYTKHNLFSNSECKTPEGTFKEPDAFHSAQTSMKHLQYTDMDIKTAAEVFWWMGCLMWPGVCTGDSGGLRFWTVHEGFNPSCTVYEFCGGYNVLHPTVFHLREETESGYFCVRHSTEEENQRCPILPLLAWVTVKGDACHSNKM